MKTTYITLSVFAIIGIVMVILFITKNNELKQKTIVFQSEKTALEQRTNGILEKAKNHLLSEGHTFIPESGVSCADQTEECLDYWSNALKPDPGNKSPCDFTNNEAGCGRNDFKILSPNGGESFCVGDDMAINWKAPADAETITLTLKQTGLHGTEYTINTFPANFNNTNKQKGEGSTVWKIPENVNASMVYKLWINMAYGGSSINDSSDKIFEIKNCNNFFQNL